MLNVPTMWTIFIVNFLALALVWAYVMRSYPKFEAAPFWTGSAFFAALGAAIAMVRFASDSLFALVSGTVRFRVGGPHNRKRVEVVPPAGPPQ